MKKHLSHIMVYAGTVLIFISIVSCGKHNPEADAFGNFEADEIIVSAQSQGILISLDVDEGITLDKDILVGKIDTTSAFLKMEQLKAQQSVISARLMNLDDQLSVQNEQRINLAREVNRIEKLLKEGAATPQQYDDITGRLKVLDTQTETIRSQKNIIAGERSVLSAQLNEVSNLLEKCRIVNPMKGVVLEKYVEASELVSQGKALYKIANTGKMELKVYVSGAQLPSIAIGDSVKVFIDNPDNGLLTLPGIVSWISSQVEFTPKIIQTREERINMVYAVKVSVDNDGRLKIGMPGEVIFRKTKNIATN